jgi:hypothetical protein
MFDPENRCDQCDKPLLVTDPIRSRCDQCVRFGPPIVIAPKIREFGVKTNTAGMSCAVCGRDKGLDDQTPVVLVGDRCVGCLLNVTLVDG